MRGRVEPKALPVATAVEEREQMPASQALPSQQTLNTPAVSQEHGEVADGDDVCAICFEPLPAPEAGDGATAGGRACIFCPAQQ